MMGGKGNNQYSNRAVGIRVQSSLYGQVVPYLAGRFRITPKLIWAGALAAKKVSSGKKSGGKKGGQTYTYSAPADFCSRTIQCRPSSPDGATPTTGQWRSHVSG
jgi:hypothetical protein